MGNKMFGVGKPKKLLQENKTDLCETLTNDGNVMPKMFQPTRRWKKLHVRRKSKKPCVLQVRVLEHALFYTILSCDEGWR